MLAPNIGVQAAAAGAVLGLLEAGLFGEGILGEVRGMRRFFAFILLTRVYRVNSEFFLLNQIYFRNAN